MSSDYYFEKWKKTFVDLENLVELDIDYQNSKARGQQWCDAVCRLTGILGRYLNAYNNARDCLKPNLQVQKTTYIDAIITAIIVRIFELKNQLRKLEGSQYHFLSNGLIDHKLTPDDAEVSDLPEKYERPEHIKTFIRDAFEIAKTKEKIISDDDEKENCEEISLKTVNWWEEEKEDNHDGPKGINIMAIYEVEKKMSVESLKKKTYMSLIQAHEKSRQVTILVSRRKHKREIWEKDLKGILNPPATLELREKGAKLIQRVIRVFFELKRERIKSCKRNELLQLSLCHEPMFEEIMKDEMMHTRRVKLYKTYEEQRNVEYNNYKQKYFIKHRDDMAEHLRDYTREWLQYWFKEAKFFYNIPKENLGGISSIIKEETPSPSQWLEQYKVYMEKQKANKRKTNTQLQFEKLEAKQEKLMAKKEELFKKKIEANLMKKATKNPTLQSGYNYPKSKTTEHLLKAINDYRKDWMNLDKQEILGVKEKYVTDVDVSNACMEVKTEICKDIDNDMRTEFKLLWKALKTDYKRNNKEMPERIKQKAKRKKIVKKKKIIKVTSDIVDKLSYLITKGFIKEYQPTKLADFLGDSNYAGGDLRCLLRTALPFGGETRAAWWERCCEVTRGQRRLLLVGARGSGKSTLVHIIATLNDAVLYELDPETIDEDQMTPIYLEHLVTTVAACARGTQPAVIYIKHLHQLYCRKVPTGEDKQRLELIKRYFIRLLFKKINKSDFITIIGGCAAPWLTKSKQLLKKFSAVIVVPGTTYSAVSAVLRSWVLRNRIVPPELDIQSLAYVLQGYSFGYLVETLNKFLTADRIVKIAAYGLSAVEVYDYFLEDKDEEKVDHKKYMKWYIEKTPGGKSEQKTVEEQREYRTLLAKWTEKMEKKRKKNTPL